MKIDRFFPSERGALRGLAGKGLRSVVGVVREGRARSVLTLNQQGKGPTVVFLPAGPAEGAALLRIYNIASALQSLGWRTAVVPWRLTLSQRQRYLRAARPDVVVMQGARHDLNRPHLYPDWPVVFDMDDADFHLDHLVGPVTEAMPHVAAVVAGSGYIARWCTDHGAPQAHVVWTGTPMTDRSAPVQGARAPVLAWGQTRPMQYKREAALMARVAARVAALRPGTTLRLYDRRPGDDPGFAARFVHPGLVVDWRDTCDYQAYLASMEDAAVGLAPLCPETPFSRGKSFGKILSYLQAGVPVVASATGEPAQLFADGSGVLATDDAAWTREIIRLLDDPSARQAQAARGFAAFETRLTDVAAARALSNVLADVLVARGHARATMPADAA